MWYSKWISIFVLGCTCCTIFVEAEDTCGQTYEIPKWETTEGMPGGVRLNIIDKLADEYKPALGLQVQNRTENVTVTLLANPFIVDGKCPDARSSYTNLKKSNVTHRLDVGDNERVTFPFPKIFTGCYYVEMTNAKGKKWLWKGKFFETDYHFYDTMLKCKTSEFNPEDSNRNKQLRFDLEIPQSCFELQAEIFELDSIDNDTKENLNSEKIPPSQICNIQNKDNKTASIDCKRVDTNLNLTYKNFKLTKEGWRILITWNHLKRGSAYYYTKFIQRNHACTISSLDLTVWRPIVSFGAVIHGLQNLTNQSPSRPPDFLHSKEFTTILYILLGLTIAAILIFWMCKYAKLAINRRRRTIKSFENTQEIIKLHDQRESNEILLIYAKDSIEFMKTMEAFRERLQYSCNVTVRDVYSDNEWSMVTKLGATGWVDDLLKEGSKVVWVDTPKFRSVINVNDPENGVDFSFGDFRDEAIPYANSVAVNLFQNATTQYCRHFVVRLEGFKVNDGPDDPLLVVSPYVRYCIPAHLSHLCEDLTK